ncbi:MAG: hypothetical protein GY798_04085 [Hyphomicrobiales bacterium]|nr:hypothetical protein [Hyphomicrobiales bacterium]
MTHSHYVPATGERRGRIFGWALAAASVCGVTLRGVAPSYSADDAELGEWEEIEHFGPADGGILTGDGAFFLGGNAPILDSDRVYAERWIDVEVDQALVVTVSVMSKPDRNTTPEITVRDRAGSVVGRSVVGVDAGNPNLHVAQLEFSPPETGRYRVLLTSVERFDDLVRYSVDAVLFGPKPEDGEDGGEEGGGGGFDFTDYNQPPDIKPRN